MALTPPPGRDYRALLPVLAGALWLAAASPVALALGLTPGLLLFGGGLAVLWRVEPTRAYGAVAAGGLLGMLLWLPGLAITQWWRALDSGLLSAASFLLAGRAGLELALAPPMAPSPPSGWRSEAKAALDQALVAYFSGTAAIPGGQRLATLPQRLSVLVDALDDPAVAQALTAAPPAPPHSEQRPRRAVGFRFAQITFVSGFAPPPALGAPPAWLSSTANARASAWVLRQPGPGRPWLLCVHGYRMGLAWMDLRLFRPAELFERHGYNLVVPTLPLHGVRRAGRRSGDGYLDGELTDLVYAQAQALWDLRRWLAWIRVQEPGARIGVVGYSLGGYNAALLAAHEPELEFVAAGIPVADLTALLWDHLPLPQRGYLAACGVDRARYRRLLAPVSPLTLPPRLAAERLAIFAGSADRVVPPAQPLVLARHWGVEVEWFPGGHLTFIGEPAVAAALRRLRRAAGWEDEAAVTLGAGAAETSRS
ncbi:MAG: prolyl oligopeptidase family serine peptidase [Gammaproteobacteria bacterium]|nr:prolyl oligopeptidase family serine peptidase [Gammaproteobacteria bacterium]